VRARSQRLKHDEAAVGPHRFVSCGRPQHAAGVQHTTMHKERRSGSRLRCGANTITETSRGEPVSHGLGACERTRGKGRKH
jgi:hypothetical protein